MDWPQASELSFLSEIPVLELRGEKERSFERMMNFLSLGSFCSEIKNNRLQMFFYAKLHSKYVSV